jgi:hypothetical protein
MCTMYVDIVTVAGLVLVWGALVLHDSDFHVELVCNLFVSG